MGESCAATWESLKKYLSLNALIIYSPKFKAAGAKEFWCEKVNERDCVELLLFADGRSMQGIDPSKDFADMLLLRHDLKAGVQKYKFLLPISVTSWHIKHTYSKVGSILTKKRNKINPVALEAIVLLKEIWKLVSYADVQASMTITIKYEV